MNKLTKHILNDITSIGCIITQVRLNYTSRDIMTFPTFIALKIISLLKEFIINIYSCSLLTPWSRDLSDGHSLGQ
jgi:hypothetical protein